ncbi:MAG: AbrB/MazE/SpoVT family DNA-binding domain-containing protein [Phycisphaerae bacterium]|nr:AbrB/MazE/SpoVT family DNA-binding domain-containing protein [Phycisphaerae bacterium]
MVKTLKKHGNSQALVIEKSILDAMGIDADTPLQVTVSGQALIVTPVNVGVGTDAVSASVRKLRKRYAKTLKRLAE